jgi:hypothetical protein
MGIAIMLSLCRSQDQKKEERWTEVVQIPPPPVKEKRRKKPTMNERYRNSYRLGRRSDEQGSRPLSQNQDRIEKLTTGTTIHTTTTTKDGSQRLKITKDIFTVGTWNVRTL